jgi:SAM-dependent methyltransferase
MNVRRDDLSERNINAWSRLYRSTPRLVWGSRPVGFLEPFLAEELAAGHKFPRVLDAAGGEGRNLSVLARLANELTLCDASASALEKIPTDLAAKVRRVQCDLDKTPFQNGEFDFILLCDVVETLPEPLPALRELHRILAPGGTLICNIPGPEDEVAGVEMTELGPNRYLYHSEFFYQFLEKPEAIKLLESAGFVVGRNKLMHWEEEAHPEFRGTVHQHTSRVFLVQKPPAAKAK